MALIRAPYGTIHHASLVAGSPNRATFSVASAPGNGWDGQSAFKSVEWLQVSLRNLVGGPVTLRVFSRVAAQSAWVLHYEEAFGSASSFSKDIMVHLPALLTERWQRLERGSTVIFAPQSDPDHLPPPHIQIEIDVPAGATFDRAERTVTDAVTT